MKKIGMRTIKTGIAVGLASLVSQILNIKTPLFAGIATVITMQSSVSESWKAGKNRMLGTVLGAIIGLIFSTIAPNNPLIIGLGVIIIIYLCNILNWKKAITISCIVFMAIMLNQKRGTELSYSIFRTVDTFIGIIIGMLINYFIVPPNVEEKIKSSFYHIFKESNDLIEGIIWGNKDIEINQIKDELAIVEKNYNTLKEEFELNICTDQKYLMFKNLFILFENLYTHLEFITNLENNYTLNTTNQKTLENKYNKEIPTQEDFNFTETDIVFNYHLTCSLNQLSQLENIFLKPTKKGDSANET